MTELACSPDRARAHRAAEVHLDDCVRGLRLRALLGAKGDHASLLEQLRADSGAYERTYIHTIIAREEAKEELMGLV